MKYFLFIVFSFCFGIYVGIYSGGDMLTVIIGGGIGFIFGLILSMLWAEATLKFATPEGRESLKKQKARQKYIENEFGIIDYQDK